MLSLGLFAGSAQGVVSFLGSIVLGFTFCRGEKVEINKCRQTKGQIPPSTLKSWPGEKVKYPLGTVEAGWKQLWPEKRKRAQEG